MACRPPRSPCPARPRCSRWRTRCRASISISSARATVHTTFPPRSRSTIERWQNTSSSDERARQIHHLRGDRRSGEILAPRPRLRARARARPRRGEDLRARRNSVRQATARGGAASAGPGDGAGAGDVRRAARAPRGPDRAGARERALGRVRPLQRLHLRLPVRRRQPRCPDRRGARGAGASRPAARRDLPLRHRPGDRARAPATAGPGARPLRGRAGRVPHPRAQCLSRARPSPPANPRDRRVGRRGSGARAPVGRLCGGLSVTPFPWHLAALEQLLAARERLPHALLVHGPAGIGKVQFARALAAAVLCESPRGASACGRCPSCHWFSQGNHPDFREILPEAAAEDDEADGEAETGKAEKAKSLVIKIDQIRAVADFIALSTHRAGYRVLLLHPAEALQPAGANALLKTLEEPPPRTLIAMVSDRPSRLLPTLLSRCRKLALGAPPRA